MKKIILEIVFDDSDCYKGHGENTEEVIKNLVENEIKYQLEQDNVIKSGWYIKKFSFVDDLKSWIKDRISKEKERYENAEDLVFKASVGGKKKGFYDVLEYLKRF